MILNLNQKSFCIMTVVFNLLATSNSQVGVLYYDAAYADVTTRPMPADLLNMFTNKTEYDRDMEECMNEFVSCSAFVIKERPFCGEHDNGTKKFFYSICEMVYENCKEQTEHWHYLDDKLC